MTRCSLDTCPSDHHVNFASDLGPSRYTTPLEHNSPHPTDADSLAWAQQVPPLSRLLSLAKSLLPPRPRAAPREMSPLISLTHLPQSALIVTLENSERDADNGKSEHTSACRSCGRFICICLNGSLSTPSTPRREYPYPSMQRMMQTQPMLFSSVETREWKHLQGDQWI